jgi:putative acetyltransferase
MAGGGQPLMDLIIAPERPDGPQVAELLAALDAYLNSLYPAECNHLLGVAELLTPGITLLVARLAGRAVGCGALRRRAGYGEVKRVYVRPEARGHRVGRRLMERLEALMRAEGIRLARLETGVDQPEAIALYERLGWRRTGPFGDYPEIPQSLFYAKEL